MLEMRYAFPILALVATSAFAQRTLVVDASGGGQFTEIQQAVLAANPGDTILVRPGLYNGFEVGKGVGIVGGPGVDLRPSSRTPGFITARNLLAGQRLSIREIGTGASGSTVTIEGCAGSVHLEGLRVGSWFSILSVRNSSAVTVHQTIVSSTVSIAGASVVFSQCHLNSLETALSSVTFAEGTCTGIQPIRLVSGTLAITGDGQTSIRANSPLPSSAIVTQGGILTIDPQVQLVPSPGLPPISGPATVIYRTIPSLRAALTSTQLTTALRAPGAFRGHTLLGLPLQSPVATPFGDLWIGAHVVLDSGSMPPSGVRSVTLAIPPVAPGFTIALQGLLAMPTGIELSTPVLTITAR